MILFSSLLFGCGEKEDSAEAVTVPEETATETEEVEE